MSSGYDISTEQLVAMSKEGDSKAFSVLIAEYTFLIRERARSYLYSGIELEDLMQEGMIGFLKAVSFYNPEYKTSFRSFASLCVDRSIISAVNKVFSKSSIPKSVLVSIDSVDESGQGSIPSIENEVMVKLDKDMLFDQIDVKLSDLERKIFALFIKGYSYKKISQTLKTSEKSVDNAIQRIRRKLAK